MDEFTWMPDVTRLDELARMFMFGYLESQLDRGALVSKEDWRKAYGAAADDQTVRELAGKYAGWPYRVPAGVA